MYDDRSKQPRASRGSENKIRKRKEQNDMGIIKSDDFESMESHRIS
jgi:hypothetical protein